MVFLALLAGGCREEGTIQIHSIKFNGVEQVDRGALKSALATKEGSWLPWGKKTYFNRNAFEADLKRIEAFYRDRGFPDARVRSFDVKLNDTQDKVDITLDITEGEPIRVAGIDLRGFDVLPEPQQRSLRESLPLREGQPLDRQLEAAMRERAANVLRDAGYPYAEVRVEGQDVAPRQRRIVLQATPGTLASFGPVEINGHTSVNEQVVRRQLTFVPGDWFTRRAMRESQRKLYDLELFEFVNIEPVEDPSRRSPEVPVRVTVAEGKQQRVQGGVGYGSEEKARARIRWEHRNILGGAQQVGVEAKWSSLDRGVRLDYKEPYFFSRYLSLVFDGQAWQTNEPVFSSNQLGGRVTLRYQPSRETLVTLALNNEYQRSTVAPEALLDFTIRDELIALGLDPRTGVEQGTLSSIAFGVNRNTTNNLLDARQGYVLNGYVEQAGTWLWGTFNFWSVSGEGRYYVPVGRRLVIANRARFSGIQPINDDEANVPFYRRLFLGGATSLRGWGRYEVSPLSGFGFPIGGLSLVEASTEVRFPVAGKLGAVLFADAGNVWSDPFKFDLNDLRYSVGPGLRYMSPIGPLRVDLGYQLNPIDNLLVNGEPQKRRWRVHFSIGQAF